MKKKKIILLSFMLIALLLFAVEKQQFARLHYSGGGDWYNNSDALPNLVNYLNNNLHTDLSIEEAEVRPDEQKMFDYPFIFMTGHGTVKFSDKDVSNLREYLQRGGFLYVDDDYGLDESFRKEVKKLFPQKEFIELPANHTLFNCYYQFPKGIPKIHKHDDKRPRAFAFFDDSGRMMLLYTYETNISDGWSKVHGDPEEVREKALKMGANIIYYLMTQ